MLAAPSPPSLFTAPHTSAFLDLGVFNGIKAMAMRGTMFRPLAFEEPSTPTTTTAPPDTEDEPEHVQWTNTTTTKPVAATFSPVAIAAPVALVFLAFLAVYIPVLYAAGVICQSEINLLVHATGIAGWYLCACVQILALLPAAHSAVAYACSLQCATHILHHLSAFVAQSATQNHVYYFLR
jgi:hypothetical protein